MKKILSLLSILFFWYSSYAQNLGLAWGYTLDNQLESLGQSVLVDPLGNSYIEGVYNGSLDLDPGPGIQMTSNDTANYSLFIKKMDASGNFLWGHSFGTGINPILAGVVSGKNMAIDGYGNVFYTGIFTGTIDFDPGPNAFNMTANSPDGFDHFILKLDPNGNFLWARSMERNSHEQIAKISVDGRGNVYLGGQFWGNVDFDPGPATFFMNARSSGSFFMLKLDHKGDFLWAKSIGNSRRNKLGAIEVDKQGNLYMCAGFNGTLDVDPGTGVFELMSHNNSQNIDVFVLKLDTSGDFLWGSIVRKGGGTWNNIFNLVIDPDENVIVGSSYYGAADFDPGPGQFSMATSGNGTGFTVKLNKRGEFIWAKQLERFPNSNSSDYATIDIIHSDPLGHIYLIGTMLGEMDVDPGPAVYRLGATHVRGGFLIKLSPSGDFIYAINRQPVPGFDISDMGMDPLNNLYFTGRLFERMDIDPGPDSLFLGPDSLNGAFYLLKWTQDSCSDMLAIIDSLEALSCNNGQGYASGHALGGKAPFSYEWNSSPPSTDSFASFNIGGSYEFSVTDSRGCNSTSQVLLNGPTSQNGQDLVVNITSTPFRTGFPATIWLDAFNDGCQPVTGEVVLVLDPFLSYNSSSPPPDTIIGDSLIWYVSNMNFDSPHFMAAVDVTVSLNAGIGERICLDADISPKTNDTNTKNNSRDYCRDVINAFDPNDKLASPQGLCEEGYIEANERLTYTVRFQNTGNANAINIFILDTLDQDFDINSLKVVGQSHKPMITEILSDRVLKFRFDNIYLPDSTTDEKNSHGYVMFEVAPLAGLPVGTELTNAAGIYFDFNEPVITNTVLNTITDVLPSLDTSYVSASSCNSYTLNGRTYMQSGSFVQQLSGMGPCDSVVILNLSLQPLDTSVTLISKTLTANEGGAHGLNVSYQWVDCDNNNSPINGATQQSFTPQRNGNYAVIISRDNCSELSACTNVSVLSIDSDFQAQLKYYPNPTQARVIFELGGFYQEVSLSIQNATGQRVGGERHFGISTLGLDLAHPAGIYFVQLVADGKQAIIKLIIN
ncbi:MAG: T9SS type A sorting domain-containing protein [Bacteroidia bacterium]|nr:T9SS type A sorting domain-containing protein [Bacteroidia bacterium]